MPESDSGEKTEAATDKRMREVRREGRLSRSQDIGAWLAIGAAGLLVGPMIDRGGAIGVDQFADVREIIADPDPQKAVGYLFGSVQDVLTLVGPLLGVVFLVAIIAAAAQGGIHVKRFVPKLDHLNPLTGLRRVFGMQALWEGVKALMKTAVVGGVLAIAVMSFLPLLAGSAVLPLSAVIEAARGGVVALLASAVAAGLAIAAIDVLVVMRRNRQHTRMTKKEVRDEAKSSEGDPLIRSQRRARQLAMSRNRMIAAVGGADVVVVNPTHVAVALNYEPGKSAPRVVAKGQDEVALRIRARAEEEGVPIVRDVPLARTLHSACELGAEIPVELYTAVAKVLAFVMALKKRGSTRGEHALPVPSGLPMPPERALEPIGGGR